MSDGRRPDEPGPDTGSATHPSGTPMAVDVESDPATRRAMAMFVAGPVVWFSHFVLVYLVAEAGCTGDGPGLEAFDPPVPASLTLVATVVASVVCLWVARWEYRRWRTHGRHGSVTEGDPLPTESVAAAPLAFAGMLLGLISFVSVLFVGLPALAFQGC